MDRTYGRPTRSAKPSSVALTLREMIPAPDDGERGGERFDTG